MSPLRSCAGLVAVAMLLQATSAAAADPTHQCVEDAHEGQKQRDSGALTEARRLFVQCSLSECPAPVRESCLQWNQELTARLPTFVLGARDEAGRDLVDVRVRLDGKPLIDRLDGRSIAIDPGPHELRFEAAGFVAKEETLVAREGERVRVVVVSLARPAPPAVPTSTPPSSARTDDGPNRLPLYVGGGVAALGLAGFTVFGLWGKSERDRMADSCAPTRTCSEDDVSAARTKYIVADVSLVVALVGAGVVGWTLLSSSGSSSRPIARVSATPVREGVVGALTYGF